MEKIKVLLSYAMKLIPLAMGLWFIPFFIISFSNPIGYVLSLIYLIGSVSWIFFIKRNKNIFYFGYLVLIASFIIWFSQKPSNDRVWKADSKVLAYAEVDGDNIVIKNIRHCKYRSETDYDVRYYDKKINLNDLVSLDLILVDWGLEKIVHTMFSFGFKDGTYLCISIETRMEQGEKYSALNGFFRQYELMYVLADERDLIGLRTNYRVGEDVYIYPLIVKSQQQVKELFMEYINRINSLYHSPEWYNALTENCMTSSYRLIKKHSPQNRWHWKVLMNGYVAELAYEGGSIYNKIPYSEVKKMSLINKEAEKCSDESNFSHDIRANLPGNNQNQLKELQNNDKIRLK